MNDLDPSQLSIFIFLAKTVFTICFVILWSKYFEIFRWILWPDFFKKIKFCVFTNFDYFWSKMVISRFFLKNHFPSLFTFIMPYCNLMQKNQKHPMMENKLWEIWELCITNGRTDGRTVWSFEVWSIKLLYIIYSLDQWSK